MDWKKAKDFLNHYWNMKQKKNIESFFVEKNIFSIPEICLISTSTWKLKFKSY